MEARGGRIRGKGVFAWGALKVYLAVGYIPFEIVRTISYIYAACTSYTVF